MKYAIGLGAKTQVRVPGYRVLEYHNYWRIAYNVIRSLLLKTIEYSIGLGVNLIICFKLEYQ